MSFGIQRILWTVVAALVGIWLLPATAAPLLEDTPELGWVVIAVLDATLVGFAVWLWRQPNGQR